MKPVRIPSLDGIRGVAILLVLLAHVFHVGGGVLGVDLFFVLSGFLITSLLLRDLTTTGQVDFRRFYRRRAVRLLPPLLLVVGTVVLLACLTGRASGREFATAGIALSYATNVLLILNPSWVSANFVHLWSLAAEEQFYLLWPPLLVMFWQRKWLPFALLAAVGLSILDFFFLATSGPTDYWRYAGPDTHAAPIIIGCLAAIYAQRGGLVVGRVAAWLGATIATAVVVFKSSAATYPAWLFVLFAVACCAPILYCANVTSSAMNSTLSFRPLRYMGTISYSLYLWNSVVFATFNAVDERLLLPLVIALAAGSWRYLENPLLTRSLRSSRSSAGSKRQPAASTRQPAPQPEPASG